MRVIGATAALLVVGEDSLTEAWGLAQTDVVADRRSHSGAEMSLELLEEPL